MGSACQAVDRRVHRQRVLLRDLPRPTGMRHRRDVAERLGLQRPVNNVAPSLIATDMVSAGLTSSLSRIPVGRFGTSEECAQAVLMVVGNAYMTGQTISLSGGLSFN